MAYSLNNKYAKDYGKRTILVQLIVEDVVTCMKRPTMVVTHTHTLWNKFHIIGRKCHKHWAVSAPRFARWQHTALRVCAYVFCRAMLCKRGLSRHAVSVCLCVRHVRALCQNE